MTGDERVRETREPTGSGGVPDPVREPRTGRVVLGALLVLVGLLWLLDAAGVTELRWSLVLPGALTVVGLALLFTARRGGHGGLVAFGIVLSVLVLATSVVPVTTPLAGVGDRTERPGSVEEAAGGYELAMGTLTVDLRDLSSIPDGAELSASVGMGELVVRLPAGVGADVRASAGAGEVVVGTATRGGVGVSLTRALPGDPTLVLDVSVGMGTVEVGR